MDAIQRRVEQETAANADLAETEWRQSAKARRVHGISARPGIQVVPAGGRIRVPGRASKRHETRRVLNQVLVDLLHGGGGKPASP